MNNRGQNWSKNGIIAYSDLKDSKNLSFTNIESIDGGSTWSLAPKRSYSIRLNETSKINEISQLIWSSNGNDLSVIDNFGNLSIITLGLKKTNIGNNQNNNSTNNFINSCLEDLETIYQDYNINIHSKNSSMEILDFKWLNNEKPIIANSPAIKQSNGNYNYSVHQYKSYGCIHIVNNKSGFFLIRKNGLLELHYQTLNNSKLEFAKISIRLGVSINQNKIDQQNNNTDNVDNGNLIIENQWLSQAKITYLRDGHVIIVTYNPIDQYLKVYKILVNWGYNQQTNTLQPSLQVEILINEKFTKFDPKTNYLPLKIDQIKLIPPNFSTDTDLDILINFINQDDENVILCKYQITNKFKNLKLQKDDDDSNEIEGYYIFKLVEEIEIEEKILDISTQNFGFLLILILENKLGEVEIQTRSRKTLKLHDQINSICTLSDFGFKFPSIPISKSQKICLSPSFSGFVSLNNYNELEFFHGISKINSNEIFSQNNESLKTISVGISYLFSSACYLSLSADELIPLIQKILVDNPNYREEFITKLLKECHTSLNFSLDYPKDQIDKIIVSPPVQKLLSLQNSLAIFHQQQRINKRGSFETLSDAIIRSDTVLSNLGTINWFSDFLIFSIQELIKFNQDSTHKTVILSLILGKISRNLIIYSIAGIKRIENFLIKIEEHNNNYIKQNISNSNKNPSIDLIKEILTKSFDKLKLLKKFQTQFDQFETFLNSLEKLIQIPENSLNSLEKLEIEQYLILENKIPEFFFQNNQLMPKILELFQNTFVINNDNLSSIYLHDCQWLNLQIKENQLPTSIILKDNNLIKNSLRIDLNKKLVDDITKLKLIINPIILKNLKVCNRCGNITVSNPSHGTINEIFGSNYSYGDEYSIPGILNGVHSGNWMIAFQRSCTCGGFWGYFNRESENYII
ncbi:hypothetical protein WICMUC_000067 [Wickerhamomyces mucosus]|uniref:Mediator of RNA polymerase II transcription subunit 16 n=1 Tax=Wickerhamomyces mucosus TaxID=1378264 RepID=A0A9P8Q171_9ASCO|nr:hypothetical protein WICMUC_000067 [Wickerhamomyces mucosus]